MQDGVLRDPSLHAMPCFADLGRHPRVLDGAAHGLTPAVAMADAFTVGSTPIASKRRSRTVTGCDGSTGSGLPMLSSGIDSAA
jgi:hypothetical protein